MAIEDSLYVAGVRVGTGATVWRVDRSGNVSVFADFSSIDSKVTHLTCVKYFSGELYVGGRYHDGGTYTNDGVIYKYDGSSWSVEETFTGGDSRVVFDLEEFGGALYAQIQENTGVSESTLVYEQTGAGVWTQRFDWTSTGDTRGLFVVEDTYLISVHVPATGSGSDFALTKDGTTWYGSGDAVNNQTSALYVFWDDANSYYRYATLNSTLDRSTPSLDNGSISWTNRAQHYHPAGSPGFNTSHDSWGKFVQLANRDVLVVPANCGSGDLSQYVRRWSNSGSSWSNEYQLASGAEYIRSSEYERPAIVAWGSTDYYLITVGIDGAATGHLHKYVDGGGGSGTWSEVHDFGGSTQLADIESVGLPGAAERVMRVEDLFMDPASEIMKVVDNP